MGFVCSGKIAGLFLDRFTGTASQRGWIPTNANSDNSTGGRCSFANGKHVHLPSIRSTVQLA